jgi:ferrous iron transport protein A
MSLTEGKTGRIYRVGEATLPVQVARHLEALGMTRGSALTLLQKKKSAVVVGIRGARFALGHEVARHIEVADHA